jgi:hypothetical protein
MWKKQALKKWKAQIEQNLQSTKSIGFVHRQSNLSRRQYSMDPNGGGGNVTSQQKKYFRQPIPGTNGKN